MQRERVSSNTQLFALRHPPPSRLRVQGRAYELVRVFKHDFYAATALYAAAEAGAPPEKLVVKFGREQPFCGLPLAWIGRHLLRRERALHRRVDGVPGVQRWVAAISPTAYALEYLEGITLDRLTAPPPAGFFDRLRELIDAFHARGAAYGDLHKRSNILVAPDGRPGLIDFQISLIDDERASWPRRWWVRRWVRYLQRMDLYHLYKHKRRLAPDELTEEQQRLSRPRGRVIAFHRRMATPLRRLRRAFLNRLHRKGKLVSPSAHLEDHEQPEKATWRHEG